VNGSELLDHIFFSESDVSSNFTKSLPFHSSFDESTQTLQSNTSFDILIFQVDKWIPLGTDCILHKLHHI